MFEKIYRHDFTYALENNEVELYRISLGDNVNCRNAIEKAIRDHYDGLHLDTAIIADSLTKTFGLGRVVYVLANTIQDKSWDGRFCSDIISWAKQFTIGQMDTTAYSHHHRFIIGSHPGLINILAVEIRKRYTAAICGKEVAL